MLKEESLLPVKPDMDRGKGTRIDITLCSCAAVFSRKAAFIVLNKVSHTSSSAPWGKEPEGICLHGWCFGHPKMQWLLNTLPGPQVPQCPPLGPRIDWVSVAPAQRAMGSL